MKAFSNFRRSIGALYGPKARDQRHARQQALRREIAEGMEHNSAGSDVSMDGQESYHSARCSEGQHDADMKGFPQRETTIIVDDPANCRAQPLSPLEEALEMSFPPVSTSPARTRSTSEDTGNEQPVQADEADVADDLPVPEDAQALRDAYYIAFSSEDENDYTAGPVRFIAAADGYKDCAAILMTMELSSKIQIAVQAQRVYKQAQLDNRDQRQAFMMLEGEIEARLASCRARLLAFQKDGRESDPAATELEQHHEILTVLLDDVEKRRDAARTHLQVHADNLRNKYAAAIGILEEAFVAGSLVEQDAEVYESPCTAFNLDTEYATFCEKLKGAYDQDGEYIAPPLEISDMPDHVQALSEEDKARQEIVERFWQAKIHLHQAHRAFEDREVARAREYVANAEAAEKGLPTSDDSPEAFDIRWVKVNQDLTRALIDAEATFAAAKAEMCEAGVELPPEDQTSILFEREDDGYRMSFEQNQIASIPSPTVKDWMSAIPGDAAVELRSPAEVDEWDADEVGISDSVSVVAEGSERRRIDHWRQLCGV